MSKKIIATIVVTIMVLSIFSVASFVSIPASQAQAPMNCQAYGLTPICVFLQPGVPDPFNPGFSLTLGTLRLNPDVIASDVASLSEQNDFSVLMGSTGDLMFNIQVLAPVRYIEMWLPPQFTFTKPMVYSVWTDITNDYANIAESTRGAWDTTAPLWNRFIIGTVNAPYGGGYKSPVNPMSTNVYIQPGLYHIRFMGLTAPNTVGLYYFKIATDAGMLPVADFPIMIVKGEVNTAYVTGLIESNEAPDPVSNEQSGIIYVTGTSVDGRTINGVDVLSPEDACPNLGDKCANLGSPGAGYYRYYIFGLPAGSYTINGTLSGDTVDTTTISRFSLAAGQSFHMPVALAPGGGTAVSVHVFSKYGTGVIPWCSLWQPPFGTNLAGVCDDFTRPRDINIQVFNSAGAAVGLWGSDYYKMFYGYPIEAKAPTSPGADDYLMQLTDGIGSPSPTGPSTWKGPNANTVRTDAAHPDGLPSIEWMTVPSILGADYVTGFEPGTSYSVKGFVTGYVMTTDDAFQRTFTASGSTMAVEMDLRRSAWLQITAHEFENLYPTTLMFAVVPTGTAFPVTPGTESGMAGLYVLPPSQRTPAATLATYPIGVAGANPLNVNDFTVILEGWAEGGGFPTWDYGLATSSGSTSTGGTYDIHMLAADEGNLNPLTGVVCTAGVPALACGPPGTGIWYIRSGEPFTASVPPVGDAASALSFRVRSITIGLTLRSVDSEVPAHQRPWTFPGSEIWVNFIQSGKVVASLSPIEYSSAVVGSPASWTPQTPTSGGPFGVYGLVQDNGLSTPPMSPYDADTVNAPGMHGLLQMTWSGFNPDMRDVLAVNTGYPTSLPPGQYDFMVYTYGYVMAREFPVQVPDGGKGDIQADLIQGGMVRVNLDFEAQNEKVHFNGFVRVELWNSSNALVASNIYGMAQPNVCDTPTGCSGLMPIVPPATTATLETFTGNYLDYSAGNDFMHYQYVIPGVLKGPAEGSNMDPYPQRAFLSHVWYGVPSATWAGWPAMNPSDSNRLNYDTSASQSFDLYGFHWYYGSKSSRDDGYWANGWETTDGTFQNDYGIRGSVDTPEFKGGGLYTIKVYAFDPYGQDGIMGTADDWQSFYAGTAPTWQAATNVAIPWGGAATVGITMYQLGRISGTPTWLDMYGDMAFVPWATVTAGSSFAPSTSAITPSWGLTNVQTGGILAVPSYFVWVPAGTTSVSVSVANAPQIFAPASTTFSVSDGWSGTYDVTLVPTGVPVPEFPTTAFLVLFSALGASVYLLRRRKTTK